MQRILGTFLILSVSLNGYTQNTNVLFEHYTGVNCVTCPQANVYQYDLENQFGDSLISINIHAGNLATPGPNDPDFTTSEGDEYWNFFTPFTPNAGINRRMNTGMGQPYTFGPAEWIDEIDSVLNIPSPVDMNISYTYNPVINEFDITVHNTIQTNLSGDHNIVYCIVEDDVVASQDSSFSVIQNYSHQNVFRDALTNPWGDLLFSGSINTGAIFIKHVQYVPSSAIQNINNCSIIAYIRNTTTENVIQVAKQDIDGVVNAEENDLLQLSLQPNPTSDMLRFSFDASIAIHSISILDGTGRIVLEQKIQSNGKGEIDLSGLSTGSYMVQVQNDGKTLATERIQKL